MRIAGWMGMFVLAVAAGLAVLPGTTAAHAATAAPARAAAAAYAQPEFEPCPCADPACRPVCFLGPALEPGKVGAGSPGYLRYVRE
jgi:hypothetical protein